MTTLVRAGAHRCDATCHNARGSKCACICGGVLHGQGYAKALSRLDGLEVRLPMGVSAASIHLPAVLPDVLEKDLDYMPRYDHSVTLTVRWDGPPDEVEMVGAALVLAASESLADAFGVKAIDARVAPWLSLDDHDREHMDRVMIAKGRDASTWWTAKFMQLCASSDASHLDALRAAAPELVDAYEAWREGPRS
jgi:hypothetical protein